MQKVGVTAPKNHFLTCAKIPARTGRKISPYMGLNFKRLLHGVRFANSYKSTKPYKGLLRSFSRYSIALPPPNNFALDNVHDKAVL